MKIVLLLLVVIDYVWTSGRRFVPPPSERIRLNEIDETLVQLLTEPNSYDEGDDVYENIEKYNSSLKDIIEGFTNRRVRYIKIAHILYDKGGPQYLQVRLDHTLLFAAYGWTIPQFGDLHMYIIGTVKLWQEFCELYEKMKETNEASNNTHIMWTKTK